MKALAIAMLCLIAGAQDASAHGGHETGLSWSFDPWLTVPLLLSALLLLRGFERLWRRARRGRKHILWCALACAAGWVSLAAALVSPFHSISEQLFTAHMIEHEIIMAIAAPLLVMARPGAAFLWSLPRSARRAAVRLTRGMAIQRSWSALTQPLAATLLHAIAIWAWHLPALFDAAVTNLALHRLQHLSFFVTALFFWWAMLRRSDRGVAAGDLFFTMIHTGILGAILVFAPRVLYGAQTALAPEWGLTPLEDQQLAGLIMWVPAGTIYAGAALVFFARWISQSSAVWEAGDARAP
jgi:putative membrane protein